MKFIVKLSPEITIKSAPVRRQFIKQLRRNIRTVLKPTDQRIVIEGAWDSIEITTRQPERAVTEQAVKAKLSHIPGISHWLQVAAYPLIDSNDIATKALTLHAESLSGKTFCVRCQRSGQHPFRSVDIERQVGAVLKQQTAAAGVDLTQPQVTVVIAIKDDRYFLVQQRGDGLGGFPLGTQEPVLSLLSGGFDSTVASFLTTRRGMKTHFCLFNLGGRAHERAVKKIAYYLWHRFSVSHPVTFVTVPFDAVVREILNTVHNAYWGVVLKRMMLRAASRIAKAMKIPALVTGESVAQVASQTLTNLTVIDAVTDQLVLRPLITMDKQTIINTAEAIGTAAFAHAIPEYCAAISKKPITHASAQRAAAEEAQFDTAVLDTAVTSRKTVTIGAIGTDTLPDHTVTVTSQLEPSDIIVDIRHPDERTNKPLTFAKGAEQARHVCAIPFYQLRAQWPTLDNSKRYLLYCDRGVLSRLHALHLHDAGYCNVGVYSPTTP